MPCTILSHSRIDGRLNEMFCLSSITQSILFLCKFSVDRGHNDSCNWYQCKVLKCQIKKYYYNLTIEDSRVVRDKTNFSYKQRCKREFLGTSILYRVDYLQGYVDFQGKLQQYTQLGIKCHAFFLLPCS